MLEHYEERNSECNKGQIYKGQLCNLGVFTLKQAYDRVVSERQQVPPENTKLFNEIRLQPNIFPDFPRRPGVDDRTDMNCNYVVFDPTTEIVHFYSRIPGTKNCP